MEKGLSQEGLKILACVTMLVDHAALLIAVHDGVPGGTRRTIEYAMGRGLDIVDIPPISE